MNTDKRRISSLNEFEYVTLDSETVVYWMSRDQRVEDNWSLYYSYEISKQLNKRLIVVFHLTDNFLNANLRAYDFMIRGLDETQRKLREKNIDFHLITGEPSESLYDFFLKHKPAIVVSDFDPLKIKISWQNQINSLIKPKRIPFHIVDSHNIVPCFYASDKQEYSARFFRTKIHKKLTDFLRDVPEIPKLKQKLSSEKVDLLEILSNLQIDRSISPVNYIKPGSLNAEKTLREFIEKKLQYYSLKRNDPSESVVSDLSAYLHFGQIAAYKIYKKVMESGIQGKEEYIEELVVRRELSDNFCFYNKDYDAINCAPQWAKLTLEKHKNDQRVYTYSLKDLEEYNTHDDLWNAAQKEMVLKGKMHGYMRMYWAKKIFEWSENVEDALKNAIFLNDKYSIDGRDPNGYSGIAWSMVGNHDRAFQEREIFGKIRYMSYQSQIRKINLSKYLNKINAE